MEAPTGLRSQGGVMVAWQSSLEMNEEQQQNEEQKMNEKQQPTSQKLTSPKQSTNAEVFVESTSD